MRIDVLTLFPDMFKEVLATSILKRAADPSLYEHSATPVNYHLHDIRRYTDNKHDKVDKPPYGGGPGMVIQCQPVWDAVHAVEAETRELEATRIVLSPQGVPLTQPLVEQLASRPRLLLLTGHYEGFDERVLDALDAERPLLQISLGDYILSGGELAAMVLIDAVVRLQPGVLGDETSTHHESFSTHLQGGLDYPHYTRPPTWAGHAVPDILLSGHHAQIEAWRREQSQKRTAERRPDLI